MNGKAVTSVSSATMVGLQNLSDVGHDVIITAQEGHNVSKIGSKYLRGRVDFWIFAYHHFRSAP